MGQPAKCFFLELQKSFDTVNHNILIEELEFKLWHIQLSYEASASSLPMS